MAKDNREIVHGIRMLKSKNPKGNAQSITYASGMEDELAAAFSQEQLDAMKKRGDITGNWKSTQGAATVTRTAPTSTAATKKEGSEAVRP